MIPMLEAKYLALIMDLSSTLQQSSILDDKQGWSSNNDDAFVSSICEDLRSIIGHC